MKTISDILSHSKELQLGPVAVRTDTFIMKENVN